MVHAKGTVHSDDCHANDRGFVDRDIQMQVAPRSKKIDTPDKQVADKKTVVSKTSTRKKKHQSVQPPSMTIAQAIDDYLLDHEGGNHSAKTIEWHRTALRFLKEFLQQEKILFVDDVSAPMITSWFVHLRKTPGCRGKLRCERTVQTYARSARAFFYWLVRRKLLQANPFSEVAFPKVGKPFVQTLTPEDFERLLAACPPSHETSLMVVRASARNQALLWLLYDTGIRVSELCGIRIGDIDRKQGILTVRGKGSKERRIALGRNCQRHLFLYWDHYRPGKEELAEWGNPDEEHLFLSATRSPLTKNGVTLLFARLKKRAGMTDRRISPHIFRHTFAVRYLVLGNDPFSLQELLGHEDMSMVKHYMHMNDQTIQEQKRKYSPGDHLPTHMSGPVETRMRDFNPKDRKGNGDR
ncbi:tyrosine-type recombinase/integrase [Ktedonobacteria bacterium brp13]|nr:tyrosine-type recombinase/integrase [Ktedonobacteria bacterium brp13]